MRPPPIPRSRGVGRQRSILQCITARYRHPQPKKGKHFYGNNTAVHSNSRVMLFPPYASALYLPPKLFFLSQAFLTKCFFNHGVTDYFSRKSRKRREKPGPLWMEFTQISRKHTLLSLVCAIRDAKTLGSMPTARAKRLAFVRFVRSACKKNVTRCVRPKTIVSVRQGAEMGIYNPLIKVFILSGHRP